MKNYIVFVAGSFTLAACGGETPQEVLAKKLDSVKMIENNVVKSSVDSAFELAMDSLNAGDEKAGTKR